MNELNLLHTLHKPSGKRNCNYYLLQIINPLTTNVPIYRNQSVDLQSKSTDWFLYDGNIGC